MESDSSLILYSWISTRQSPFILHSSVSRSLCTLIAMRLTELLRVANHSQFSGQLLGSLCSGCMKNRTQPWFCSQDILVCPCVWREHSTAIMPATGGKRTRAADKSEPRKLTTYMKPKREKRKRTIRSTSLTRPPFRCLRLLHLRFRVDRLAVDRLAVWAELRRCHLRRCHLRRCHLRRCHLRRCHLRRCQLRRGRCLTAKRANQMMRTRLTLLPQLSRHNFSRWSRAPRRPSRDQTARASPATRRSSSSKLRWRAAWSLAAACISSA